MIGKIVNATKSLFFRARRGMRLMRNWRRFGTLAFAALYVATTAATIAGFTNPVSAETETLGQVYVTDSNGNRISSFSINAGATKQLGVVAETNTGRRLTAADNVSFSWAMNGAYTEEETGNISGSGLYTAGVKAGFYSGAVNVTANWMGRYQRGLASVTINSTGGTGGNGGGTTTNPVLTNFYIADGNGTHIDSFTIDELKSKQLSFVAFDQNNNRITSGVNVAWSVAPIAGSITSSGLYTAGTNTGFYDRVILASATFSGKTMQDRISVTINEPSIITPPCGNGKVITNFYITDSAQKHIDSFTITEGQSKQLGWVAYDQNNQQLTAASGVTVNWSVNPLVGSITQSGMYQAGHNTGFYDRPILATATFCGKQASDRISVTINGQAIIPALTLEVDNPSVCVGGATQVRAIVRDQNGNLINPSSVFWTVSGVGSIDQNGHFTSGAQVGTAVVTATVVAAGKTLTATQTIAVQNCGGNEPFLARVDVIPPHATMMVNQTQQYIAIPYDQHGNIIPNLTFTWTSTGVGSVNQSGLFSAGPVPGNAVITATTTYKGITLSDFGTATVNDVIIQERELLTVKITPKSVVLNCNAFQDFDAVGYDQFGQAFAPGEVTFTWALISGMGSVDQNGLYHAPVICTSGTATVEVTGTRNGKSASDVGFVFLNPDQNEFRLEISPSSTDVCANASFRFQPSWVTSGQGASTPNFTWRVLDSRAGSIDQNGRFHASNHTGTYTNVIELRGEWNGIVRTAYATVIVSNCQTQGICLSGNLYGQIEDGSTPAEGKVIVYTVTVRNITDRALHNTVAKVNVPSRTTFVSANNSHGAAFLDGGAVRFEFGSLGIGQAKTAIFKVMINRNLPSGVTTIQAFGSANADNCNPVSLTSNPLSVVKGGIQPPRDGKGPLVPTGSNPWVYAFIALVALLPASAAYIWLRQKFNR